METGVAPGGGGDGGSSLPSSHSSSPSGLAPSLAAASAAAATGTGQGGSSKTSNDADSQAQAGDGNYLSGDSVEDPSNPRRRGPARSVPQFSCGEGSDVAATPPSPSNNSGGRGNGGRSRKGKRKRGGDAANTASPPPGYPAPTTTQQPLKYADVQDASTASTASNKGPLSPKKTRDNNARTHAANSVPKPRPRRNRPRSGAASSSTASRAATSAASSAATTAASSAAPNTVRGPSKLVSRFLFANPKALKLVQKLRRLKRKHAAVKLLLREFDFQEDIDFTKPNMALLIREDMDECNSEFARIFGTLANRGQQLTDKPSLMALAFAINSSIRYVGTSDVDRVDLGNCCLEWARGYMMYGVFCEGGTELTPELAREFVDKHCSFVDSIQLCCKGTNACPKGNKWPVCKAQIETVASSFGLEGADRLLFWNLWGIILISRHVGYHYALTGEALNVLYPSKRSFGHHHHNPDGSILSNPVVKLMFVPHLQAQMYTMPNCKVHTLKKLDIYERNLLEFAKTFAGKVLSDGTVVKVPLLLVYFHRLAKAPGHGATQAMWEARLRILTHKHNQELLQSIEDGTQTDEQEMEYLRIFAVWHAFGEYGGTLNKLASKLGREGSMSPGLEGEVDAFARRFGKDAEVVLEQMENCRKAQAGNGERLVTLNKLASRLEPDGSLSIALEKDADAFGRRYEKDGEVVLEQVENCRGSQERFGEYGGTLKKLAGKLPADGSMSPGLASEVAAFGQRFDKEDEVVLEQMENCRRAGELRKRYKSGEKLAPAHLEELAALDRRNEAQNEKSAKDRAKYERIEALPEKKRLPAEQDWLDAAKAKRDKDRDKDRTEYAAERAEQSKASFSKTVSELVSAANIQRVSDLPDFYGMGEMMAKSGYGYRQSTDERVQRSIIDEVIKQKDLVRDAQWGPALSTGSSNVAIARSNATASSESGNVRVATVSAGDEKETTAAAASEPVYAEPWACQCGEEFSAMRTRCGKCKRWHGGKVVKRGACKPKEGGATGGDPLEGTVVVIVGRFPEVDPRAGHAHAQLKTKIISLGGKVRGRPTKKTTHLLAGEAVDGKIIKDAERIGAKIVNLAWLQQ